MNERYNFKFLKYNQEFRFPILGYLRGNLVENRYFLQNIHLFIQKIQLETGKSNNKFEFFIPDMLESMFF